MHNSQDFLPSTGKKWPKNNLAKIGLGKTRHPQKPGKSTEETDQKQKSPEYRDGGTFELTANR